MAEIKKNEPFDNIELGLEIMSRYVAAIITKELNEMEDIDIVKKAKKLTDLTIKIWND